MSKKQPYEYQYPKVFAEVIRNRITLEELAKVLGMSKQTLVYKLKGESDWTIHEIERVCFYFGKDYYDLFK